MKIIFLNVEIDDMILACRAARWLFDRSEPKDAILAYGDGPVDSQKHFYVKRNKASITVRPC